MMNTNRHYLLILLIITTICSALLIAEEKGVSSATDVLLPLSNAVEAAKVPAKPLDPASQEEPRRGLDDGGNGQANAVAIPSTPYVDDGTTVGKSNSFTLTTCGSAGNNNAPDSWYSLTLGTGSTVTLSTTCESALPPGSWHDTRLAVLSSTLTVIQCNDDAPGCGTPYFQSLISNLVLAAGTYYIIVDGYNGTSGPYQLNVSWTTNGGNPADTLFPDIVIRESDLYDHDIVTTITPGRTHLRLSNGTPNVGLGKLHVYGVLPDNGDGTQNINQRVYLGDGSFFDRPAGAFVFHSGHNHIHVADWCTYRIREYLAGGGVGAVVAEGSKTSFCILDLQIYDSGLPNFDPDGQFLSCNSTVQGLSVGWADIYGKTLAGQNIDITDLADGTYWLESEADPDNHMLEGNEANNITRIQVVIGTPDPINPDSYEPNNSRTEVDGRPLGQINSPYLGPCGPLTTIPDLNIHVSANEDFFRFYSPAVGTANDTVHIAFQHGLGDVDMRLLNASGTEVGASNGTTNTERISLSTRAAGWYYVRIFGYNGATNPLYTMTINPPSNGAPSVTVINPPAGNIDLFHGVDAYTTTWSSIDPENNERWVTIYVNTSPVLDGNEIQLPSSLHTPAAIAQAGINSAYFPEGTYYVYASITDGGTTSGDWSTGTVTWGEQAPQAIDDLVIRWSGGDMVLDWQLPLGPVAGYNVYLRDTVTGTDNFLATTTNLSYTHVGGALNPPLLQFYVVKAFSN